MADFMLRYFICNIVISGISVILLLTKKIFRRHLSSRMQYHLWFLFLGLLFIPFLPLHPLGLLQIFSLFDAFASSTALGTKAIINAPTALYHTDSSNWMNNFTLSVTRGTLSSFWFIVCGIWIVGILIMIVFVLKSLFRLHTLKKSALPLQCEKVYRLYEKCSIELNITKKIPIYSTAFLKSPIITGCFKPCIYLPIHLISDYDASDLRYMLLHELQHYKHKDAFANHLMNLAGIFYWFNPFVWYALREMRNDREVACDTSVLNMLEEDFYEDYGNTLINFVEKISLTPFPFAARLSGNKKQMKRRILNISSYEKPTVWKKIRGITIFGVIAALLMCLTPILSTYAADENHYQWNTAAQSLSHTDLYSSFEGFDGSFVLYNSKDDSWIIYNMENAVLRVAPNSTYKIYDALFGLEAGVITPENSFLPPNHENYPFEAWNAEQNLASAMQNSVNWYFQSIDEQLGSTLISNYIQNIGYGNENLSDDFSSYWMESSLKISPIEQVELLAKLQSNSLDFSLENMEAVKNTLHISSSENGNFYGKTGTGRVNGQDVNGWFIGYMEKDDEIYCFATNIQGKSNATGSMAVEITESALSKLEIWK